MWVDSHVNLHGESFADDLDTVVAQAREAGVSTMLNICCKLTDFPAVHAVAQRFHDIYASVGTHPHDAKDNPDITAEDLLAHCHHDRVVGIGESGLDFHYNYSDSDVQHDNFRAHIAAARISQLPLIIHSREADSAMIDLLQSEHQKGAFPLLLHCFTAGPELATCVLDLGGYISFSGILTFKNARDIRAVAETVPDERILVETDCPYLAPMPFRGRRCEPSMVVKTGERLAEIRGWSPDQAAKVTTDNFFALFSKARRPD